MIIPIAKLTHPYGTGLPITTSLKNCCFVKEVVTGSDPSLALPQFGANLYPQVLASARGMRVGATLIAGAPCPFPHTRARLTFHASL